MTDGEVVQVSSFATIGAVYEDGVSLIFDGEEQPSDKHYKVNSSVFFSAGDRVKILPDSGTYVVEYVVGPPLMTELVGIPAGGSIGQVLKKNSTIDHDAAWGNVDGTLPTGGSKGQVLKKSGSTDYAVSWGDADGMLPEGGSKGQVPIKSSTTDFAVEWGDPPVPTLIYDHNSSSYSPTYLYFKSDSSGNLYYRKGSSGTWKKVALA